MLVTGSAPGPLVSTGGLYANSPEARDEGKAKIKQEVKQEPEVKQEVEEEPQEPSPAAHLPEGGWTQPGAEDPPNDDHAT
jgi:hypothetical protein